MQKSIFNFYLLKRVFRYAAPYKNKFIISLLLAILLAVLSPVRPGLIQLTINDYVKQGVGGEPATRMRMEELVIWITVIQIGLLLLESAFRFYFSYLTAWLGQSVVKDLRVLTLLSSGTWQKRDFARSIGDGVYELDIKVPQSGLYFVFVESRSQGVNFRQLPYLTLQTVAATATNIK